MKAVTQYQADDGSIWASAEDAAFRDDLSKEVSDVMGKIGSRPELPHCDFSNGGGYYQHHPDEIEQVQIGLLAIVETHGWAWEGLNKAEGPKHKVHPSWFGRMLDGGRQEPLSRAYSRLCSIDEQGREWGQPYYADHPDQAKQICLGKSYRFKAVTP